VVGAQHPGLVAEQLLGLGQGLLRPTHLTKQIGEVVTRDERVGVLGAQQSG
jgi:hypothetical protein